MHGELPTYKISIDESLAVGDEQLGISQIAYTANPAIMAKGVAFSETKKQIFTDSLKLRLAAPILIADLPIYRRDEELGEYNVVFTKEMIEKLVVKFKQYVKEKQFNLDHDGSLEPNSFIVESWFVEKPETDKMVTVYGLDPITEGSYFVVSQFTDENYFKKEIIEKGRTGYSIEGFLGMEMSKIAKQIKQNMKNKFEEVQTADGGKIFIDGATAVDSVVYCNMPSTILLDGKKAEMRYPVYESVIELANGNILLLEDGKIVEIKQKEASAETAPVDETPAEEPVDNTTPETMNEQEKLAEGDMPTEPVSTDAPAPADETAAIMAVVKPMIDDLIKQIAEIKNMIETDSSEGANEDATAETEMKKKEKMSSQRNTTSDVLTSYLKHLNG